MGGSFNWMLHFLKCINFFLFCFWQKYFSLIFDVVTLLLFLINWPIKIEQKVKEKMVEAQGWFAYAYFIFLIKKKLQQQHEPASSPLFWYSCLWGWWTRTLAWWGAILPLAAIGNVIAGIGVRFLMLTRFKTHTCCGVFWPANQYLASCLLVEMVFFNVLSSFSRTRRMDGCKTWSKELLDAAQKL